MSAGHGAVTRLIAWREITERLHSRVTRLMTLATALLVAAGVTVPGLISSCSNGRHRLPQ